MVHTFSYWTVSMCAFAFIAGLGKPAHAQAFNSCAEAQAAVIKEAKANIGKVDYGVQIPNESKVMEPKGWETLGAIYVLAANKTWTPAELKASQQPGGKSWCGVFDMYVYKRIGLQGFWDMATGKPVGVVEFHSWDAQFKNDRAAFEDEISPGDIVAFDGKLNHHAIVVSRNGTSMVTVDGNQDYGRILQRTDHTTTTVNSIYRPLDCPTW